MLLPTKEKISTFTLYPIIFMTPDKMDFLNSTISFFIIFKCAALGEGERLCHLQTKYLWKVI